MVHQDHPDSPPSYDETMRRDRTNPFGEDTNPFGEDTNPFGEGEEAQGGAWSLPVLNVAGGEMPDATDDPLAIAGTVTNLAYLFQEDPFIGTTFFRSPQHQEEHNDVPPVRPPRRQR
jgi:hypothetical protein